MDAFPPPATPYGPPCPGCGELRTEDDARGVAWSSRHDSTGAVRFVCPDCTRAELPGLEAGIATARRDGVTAQAGARSAG